MRVVAFCVGAVLGGFAGTIATFILAEPLCSVFGVRSFEGTDAYFILFFLAPAFVVTGALAGGIICCKAAANSDGKNPVLRDRLREQIRRQDEGDS